MATTAALPEAMRTYLATCSAEHADQIIQTLRQSASMTASTGSKAAKIVKRRNKKAKREKAAGAGNTVADVNAGGPKRPLNSWMAFRKYYNGSLSPYTQKAISKVLMTWWREDPFSAKWAILAKAYSMLRGAREKDEAPLDVFLSLAVPIVGVVPPELYPQMMGWQVIPPSEDDQEKLPQVSRIFAPNFEAFDDHLTSTTLSVDDVVDYCKRAGYLNDGEGVPSATGGTLTMAVQPALTAAPFAHTEVQTAYAADLALTAEPLSPFSMSLAAQLNSVLTDAPAEPTGRHAFTTAPAEPAGRRALAAATTAVTNAGSYPYNNLFDPTAEFDISFNPNEETAGLADGGIFDAYDPSTNMTVDDMLNIDWTQFVNDDSMA